MTKIFFFFFIIIIIIFLQSPPQIQSQTIPRNISIFILAGQSNMAGRGGVYNDTATNTTVWDGVIPQECRSNPSILRLTAKLKWEIAKEPLHVDIDVNKTNGIGPGMSFADRLFYRFGHVGLVPCSIGGTKLSQWQKGEFLYEETVRRAKAAVASSGGGSYRGILWYQGESDTVDMVDASVYKKRLVKYFTDLRSDLDQPNLPIIQAVAKISYYQSSCGVALATGAGPYLDAVRKAQLKTDLKNVYCVDAMGLPLEPDGLHLTTSSQVRLGQMIAQSFADNIPNSAQPLYMPLLITSFCCSLYIIFLEILAPTLPFL
ncbi:PREDICTED: probable carbohydrate esterase At4g34215 isoform X1 [Camelina sativa]|uniref:Probable carbohydrate esterase At4g34215 isoform X1 n=1 Tax=Camelina sativa TaxID=90675 RepID=A0ABM0ZHF4_CAMSA|nr:PREDICTED: probable carbohydrate esterase At4g34215 isoform X1 [Camelina sativa]